MDQKISSDLFLDVLDDCVKRGAELPTDHYLVVWKALEDREARKQFAFRISSKFRQLHDTSEDMQKE